MKDKLSKTIEGILHARQAHRRYIAILLVLAMLTVLGVNWSLHQKGLSMTADSYTQETVDATAETAQDELDTADTQDEPAQDEPAETDADTAPEEDAETAAVPATLDLPDEEYAVDTQDAGEADMQGYLTKMTGSGTKYDANGNLYKSDLKIEFEIPASTVRDNKDYCYNYPEGIIVPDGLLGKTYDLYDDANNKAGTYYFTKNEDGTYSVHIDFKSDYEPTRDPVKGYIQFAGEVDGSKGDDDGNISIVGSDKVTLDIPKSEIDYPGDTTNRYDIKTSKTGSYSKDGKLTYTVCVYSMKGTPDVIDFADTITGTGLTLGTPEITVKKQTVKKYANDPDGGGTQMAEETITPDYTYNDGSLSMKLPQIDPAKHNEATGSELANDEYTRYEITYTYDVSDINDTAFVDNKATGASSNGNTTVKSEAEKHVDVKTTVDNVTKTGTGAGGVDYISWTITVNRNQDDIVGAELHDDMLKNLIPGHFTINPQNGYEIVYDDAGNITSIKFTDDGSGGNTNTYTITYRTPAQGNWNGGSAGPVSNTVDFDHGGKTDSATATVDGVSPVRIDKTVGDATENADGKTVTVEWTVKITVPADKLPAGTVIKDDPTKDIYGNAGGTQYRTRQQALDWANGIYWASYGHDGPVEITGSSLPKLTDSDVAAITFTGSDGKEHTLEEIQNSTDDTLTYTVATITLKQDLDTPANAAYLMFHYTTTADITQATTSGTNYYNTASIGEIKGGGVYTYKKSDITKTDEEGSTDKTIKVNEDGSLTWKIKVTLGKTADKLTITDTLPGGVTLVSIAGEGNLDSGGTTLAPAEDGTISGKLGFRTVEGTYKDGELTVNVASGDTLPSGTYTLVVNCKVDMTADGYESGKTYTFTNRATAKADDVDIGSADQTQDWTEDTDHSNAKIVDKTGAWDNNSRRVKYSIKLNPYGKDIVEGSETLTLKDVFEYYPQITAHAPGDWGGGTAYDLNVWLVPDSVRLYKGIPDGNGGLTKGEEIKNWNWTVTTGVSSKGDGQKTSTLIGTNLPDSTPLILEYDYQLQSQIPEDYETNVGNYKVSNSAELTGTDYKDSQTGSEVNWGKQETTGAVTSDLAGTLYKVRKGSYGITLPGADFKLEKYDGSEYVNTGVIYTTDESGKITVKWEEDKYEYNVLYRLVETAAPTGYELPADPESNAFYFYFSSSDDTANTLPDVSTLAPNAADLAKESSTFYVENESNTTELTINKKWLDTNGNPDASHTAGSVTVNLYQVAGKAASGTATLSGELKGFNEWGTYDWQTIESKEYPAGATISFTLTKSNWVPGEPEIKVNGQTCEAVVTDFDYNNKNYTYTFTLSSGANTISGMLPTNYNQMDSEYTLSEFTVQEPANSGGDDTEKPTPTLYGTYTITAADNWSLTIPNLPTKGKGEDGSTVYYTYYIEEVGAGNYDVSYDNNEGIASGTITVTNKATDNPSFELPATGGPELWFTTGGIAMVSTALLYGYLEIRRKRREVKRSL